MDGGGLAQPLVSIGEAQAYVRIETGEEEALLAGLVRTASAVCEAFLNRVVIAREFTADVPASAVWERLPVSPVQSITSVDAVDGSGVASALPAGDHAVDIDADGNGWVRLLAVSQARRLRVRGIVGLASGQNAVPEPIRQGVLRLVAHMFEARDGSDGAPPAAVTALWRPYRRMRLA